MIPRKSILTANLVLALMAVPTWAGGDHDHGDAPPVATGNGPQRLPDGSVLLPKPAQRQIGVRTLPVVAGELQRSLELAGKTVMDPNAGGRVQAMVTGRLEAGPKGFPNIGQAVRKGDVLAYVVPSANPIERANQTAQLAELRAARDLAEKRLTRLKELADTIPRKEIEATESELASLAGRMAAVGGGLSHRDALIAPVSGVIASSTALAGQVVDIREQVFEVVDPRRLRVEALAYDPGIATDIAAASIAIGQERIPLSFLGSGRSLREQALPLMFRGEDARLGQLAVGQPLKVFVRSRSKIQGYSVPAAALMKNPSNQTIVWVKTAPERFEPRTVSVEPLDGTNVAVTSGLKAGDRVATQGASLINQVR